MNAVNWYDTFNPELSNHMWAAWPRRNAIPSFTMCIQVADPPYAASFAELCICCTKFFFDRAMSKDRRTSCRQFDPQIVHMREPNE